MRIPEDPAPPSQWSDLDLAVRCATRDDAAWRELLRRTGPVAREAMRRALLVAGIPDAGHEADALMGGWAQALLERDAALLRAYRPPTPLAAYMAVVARTVAVRRLRRHRRSASIDAPGASGRALADLLEAPADEAPYDPGLLEEALARLSAPQRLLIRLAYWEGMRYADIAPVLGVPEANVGTLMTRARAALRSELEKRK